MIRQGASFLARAEMGQERQRYMELRGNSSKIGKAIAISEKMTGQTMNKPAGNGIGAGKLSKKAK